MAGTLTPTRRTKRRSTRLNTPDIPLLEAGDVLTRAEFERRYAAMPHLKKAELIEGRVYMASTVRKDHGQAHAFMMGWLSSYAAATPGVELYDNTTVILDEHNEAQPDALLRIPSRLQTPETGRYIEHPPELIVEIAGSSASYDLHEKLRVYQRHGVQEYVIWRIYDNEVDWLRLVDGQYAPLAPDADAIIRSRVFPDLALAVESLLAGDMAEVLAIEQQSLQTPEHAGFTAYLGNQT